MIDTVELRTQVEAPADADPVAERPSRPRDVPVQVWVAGAWVALVSLAATFADLLPLADPVTNVAEPYVTPFTSVPEFLGTDNLGRSVLARLVYGGRVSLVVGLVATMIGLIVGVIAGLIAGSHRGSDQIVSVITDAMLSIPGVVTLLALGAVMGAGFKPLLIGLSIFAMPSFLRLARANTRVVKGRDYVHAARLLGAGPVRLVVREILPSVLRPVFAYAVVIVAALMVAEASVSFLGLGVMPPTPSWGGMIANGQGDLSTRPALVLLPAVVLFLTVYSLSAIGRWLRELTSTAA